jgi:transposase
VREAVSGSETGKSDDDVMSLGPGRPETEVTAKPKRRQFTAEHKRRVLREAAACTEPGAVCALLRREGLCSSHLTHRRQQAGRGEVAALKAKNKKAAA